MFIAVEGIDGSGKTTTVEKLKSYLEAKNLDLLVTREPTNMETGKLIRRLIKNRDRDSIFYHYKLALLFAADRINHVEHVIRPAINDSKTVLCDRYVFSSFAYQSVKVSYDWIKGINKFAILPDVLIYIDVSVDTALKRIRSRNSELEVFETEQFLTKVRDNYNNLIEEYGDKIKVIRLNGELAIDEISAGIESQLEGIF